jgi:hypothetical protein
LIGNEMVHIIDVAQDVRRALPALKADGITSIIRYDCRPTKGRWKEASNAEIAAILAAGLRMGIVSEGVGNRASAFTKSTGYADAMYSRERAKQRHQPNGSAVYFALDWDISYSEMRSNAVPYFTAVREAFSELKPGLPVLRVGCYGSGMACDVLLRARLIDLAWITCSSGFQGSKAFVAAGREHLLQYACERPMHGPDVDYNLSPTGDWGWWSTAAAPPAPEPVPPATTWPAAWGAQTGKASWYSDNANADGSPVNNATDLTAASLHIPFGSHVKVTRQDSNESVIVIIKDHGPYTAGRIIDLRPAAARAINMIDEGVVAVKLEKLS